MKKTIIISAVILSSALTAFCITRKDNTQDLAKVKIEKSDFAAKTMNTANAGLASAD